MKKVLLAWVAIRTKLPYVSGMLLRNTRIFTFEFALPFVKDFKEYITQPKAAPQKNYY